MRRFNVPGCNDGFTLTETLLVILMVGILSSISAPGLLGLYARSRLNNATTDVQAAFQEGQRQAIRNSRSCTLTLDPAAVLGSCLVRGNRQFTNITVRASATALKYNIKGAIMNANGTALTQPVTVVLSAPNTQLQRCLVVSAPLGLVRAGTYSGTGTNESNCLP